MSSQKTRPITIESANWGHKKVSVTIRGKIYSCITSNTLATDVLSDSEGSKRLTLKDAYNSLYNEIKFTHNL